MPTSAFCSRHVRWIALLALLGTGAIEGTSKAAVVNIDLTGYTAANGGAAVGGIAEINPFGPSGTTLVLLNKYNAAGGLYTGVAPALNSRIASSGSTSSDTPLLFTAGATIGVGPVYADYSAFPATVFSSPVRTVGDFGPHSFLGFKTSGGQYGYIETTWTASTNTFRLISAAYQSTPGVAISTPSSVPEIDPAGMGSVLALVTGALGLLERRRLNANTAA